MISGDLQNCCNICDIDDLERKARRLAGCSTKTAVAAGNSVVIFTMLLFQELLEQLAQDPITNLSNIILIADAIARLNNNIRTDV